MKVIIISADKNSGKTTYANNLIRKDRSKYLGFLSLSNNDKNSFYLQDINSDDKILLMDDVPRKNLERIGRFYIRPNAFNEVHDLLIEQIKEDDLNKIVVIDEVGRLELSRKGFDVLLRELLEKRVSLLLCVRKCFVADVIRSYRLDKFELEVIDVPYEK